MTSSYVRRGPWYGVSVNFLSYFGAAALVNFVLHKFHQRYTFAVVIVIIVPPLADLTAFPFVLFGAVAPLTARWYHTNKRTLVVVVVMMMMRMLVVLVCKLWFCFSCIFSVTFDKWKLHTTNYLCMLFLSNCAFVKLIST